ncbi:MAG TPA: hypothetical protein VIR60_00990 [Gammaproteobacteria bacterium]
MNAYPRLAGGQWRHDMCLRFLAGGFLLMGILAMMRPAEAADVRLYLEACARAGAGTVQIASAEQLVQVSRSQGGIFCIHPGDYRAAGRLRLRRLIGSNGPKALIFYHPDFAVALRHPVDRAVGQQATVSGIDFEGGDGWLVHGITVRPVEGHNDKTPLIWFRKGAGSSNNVLEQLLVEGGGGGAGQIYFSATNDRNALRRSVLRYTRSAPDVDFHCIKVDGAEALVIEGNEIYDCAGDAIQVDSGGAPAGRIVDNDLYITPAMYTDCSGRKTMVGHCACAENAIDLKGGGRKHGSGASSGVLQIVNNRLWGFRKTDTLCGGTGDAGNAVVIHWEPADYVLISGNLIAKSDRGLNVADYSLRNPFDGTQFISIRENIFFSISDNKEHPGRALVLKNASRYEVYGNIFVDTDEVLGLGDEPGAWNEFACNLVMDSGSSVGRWGEGSVVANNTYSGTPLVRQDASPLRLPARRDGGLRWCIETRKLVAHEELCMQGIPEPELDAWARHCAGRSADERKSVGVDDVPYSLIPHEVMSILHVRDRVGSSSYDPR